MSVYTCGVEFTGSALMHRYPTPPPRLHGRPPRVPATAIAVGSQAGKQTGDITVGVRALNVI